MDIKMNFRKYILSLFLFLGMMILGSMHGNATPRGIGSSIGPSTDIIFYTDDDSEDYMWIILVDRAANMVFYYYLADEDSDPILIGTRYWNNNKYDCLPPPPVAISPRNYHNGVKGFLRDSGNAELLNKRFEMDNLDDDYEW